MQAGITTMNVWYSKLTFDGSEHTLFQKRQPLTVCYTAVLIKFGQFEQKKRGGFHVFNHLRKRVRKGRAINIQEILYKARVF